MFRIEEINYAAELHKFHQAWQRLASIAEEADFFHTYEWITTWLDCFWKDKPISFLFGYEGDELIALAPFLKDLKGELWCPKSLITPINGESRRTNILCAKNHEQVFDALVTFIFEKQKNGKLALKNARKDSNAIQLLRHTALKHNLSLVEFEKAASPVVLFKDDWKTYIESQSYRFLKKLSKASKKLEEAGDVKKITYTNVNQCDQAMEDILTIEKNSWKEKINTSFTSGIGLEEFYGKFARKAAEKGWLNLNLLYMDSKPVAHAYAIAFKNEYFILKSSYDEAYKKFSPGYVILWYSIQNAFRQKARVFDFLGGPSRMKREFSNDERKHIDICFFSKRIWRCRRCRFYQTSIKPFIKQKMPFIVDVKKRLKKNNNK